MSNIQKKTLVFAACYLLLVSTSFLYYFAPTSDVIGIYSTILMFVLAPIIGERDSFVEALPGVIFSAIAISVLFYILEQKKSRLGLRVIYFLCYFLSVFVYNFWILEKGDFP